MRLLPASLLAILAPAIVAAQAPPFPVGRTYIIQLTGSQAASGLGEYLVPPMKQAFDAAGLVYHGGPGAAFAATIEQSSDVGRWMNDGGRQAWLYKKTIVIGLTPGHEDATPPRGAPAFAVTAKLVTPDADRVDELNCLVALAVKEMAARYRSRGRVTIDGASCRRLRGRTSDP